MLKKLLFDLEKSMFLVFLKDFFSYSISFESKQS